MEQQTTSESEVIYVEPSIDYTEQFSRIEEILNSIDESLQENFDSTSYLERNNISFVSEKVNNSDIFSVLLMIVIMLGLIFGTLLFNHFRK